MSNQTQEQRLERLESWAEALTIEQLRAIVVELVDFSIDAEMVSFYKNAVSPYWTNSGEPLVPGQTVYED